MKKSDRQLSVIGCGIRTYFRSKVSSSFFRYFHVISGVKTKGAWHE